MTSTSWLRVAAADPERVSRLMAGAYEIYRTEDGRTIRLFYGPYSEKGANGMLVGKTGYCVDIDANAKWEAIRQWVDLLQEADVMVHMFRVKDEIDIAKEALGLPISNTPDPEGEKRRGR